MKDQKLPLLKRSRNNTLLENTFYKTYHYNNYVIKNITLPTKKHRGMDQELSKLEEIIYKRKYNNEFQIN